MWRRLFGGLLRSSRTAIGDGGGASPVPAASTTPDPRSRREWASLPPLKTSAQQPTDAVGGLARFSHDLIGRHTGLQRLAPLGHEVVPHAPRGIVTGVARSAQVLPTSPSPTPEMPLGPRGRRGRRHQEPARRTWRWPSPSPSADTTPDPGPDQDAVSHAPERALPVDSASSTAEVGPLSTLASPPPHVARAAADHEADATPDAPFAAPAGRTQGRAAGTTTAPPGGAEPATSRPLASATPRVLRSVAPARPATRLSAPAARPAGLPLRPLRATEARADTPTGPVHRAFTTASTTAPSQATSPPVASTPPAAPVAGDAGPEPHISPEVRPTLGAGTMSTAPDDDAPLVQRHAESSSRPSIDGPGIGAPLEDLPPTARRVHGVGRRGPTVTGRGRDEAIANAFRELPPGAPVQASLEPDRPLPPRSTGGPPASHSSAGGLAPTPSTRRPVDRMVPPVVARRIDSALRAPSPTPAPPAETVLPLASQRPPLVPGVPPPGPTDDEELDASPAPPPSAPVPVQWSTPAVPGTVAAPVPAPAGRTTTSPEPAAGRSPVMRSPNRSTAPPRITAAANGPQPGLLPRIRAVGAQPADTPTVAETTPSLGDLPARFDDHPLVQRLRESRAESSSVNGQSPASDQVPPMFPRSFSVQRDPEPARPPSPEVRESAPAPAAPVQRTVDIGEVTTTPEPATANPAPRATTEADVDQMFTKLYPRVRDELRWELRVQRERAGLLADPI